MFTHLLLHPLTSDSFNQWSPFLLPTPGCSMSPLDRIMCALYWKASTLICFKWKVLVLECFLILKCLITVIPFAGQVIFYMLFQFFILCLERNVFVIRLNWKAMTISHTTRWSFFSAFPAEGAEAVELNSLGLWDFTCFYSWWNRKLYFYFWWCRTKHPCIQQFLFV